MKRKHTRLMLEPHERVILGIAALVQWVALGALLIGELTPVAFAVVLLTAGLPRGITKLFKQKVRYE